MTISRETAQAALAKTRREHAFSVIKPKENGHAPTMAPPLVSAGEFVAGFKAPEYVIDGLFQRGRLYSLTAPTGHGKTAVALCLDIHMATGRKLADRPVEQGNVVYFAAENPDDVKARTILMADRMQLDLSSLKLHFVEGGFSFSDWGDHIRHEVERIGGALSLTVDTGPAFQAACGFADENDNMQALKFALQLRGLTKLPGNPMVLVPTHPIKNASGDNLLPRGGGAFLNEMDGNFTLWAEGERETTEMHWAGKLRGPAFDPICFALDKGTCPNLVDAKGRLIPSIWAYQADQRRAENSASRQRDDEDAVLIAMHEAPDRTLASWAELLCWISPTTKEPLKMRVQRALERLRSEKLATQKRGRWILTGAGKNEAKRLLGQAS
jgi:AAA domain